MPWFPGNRAREAMWLGPFEIAVGRVWSDMRERSHVRERGGCAIPHPCRPLRWMDGEPCTPESPESSRRRLEPLRGWERQWLPEYPGTKLVLGPERGLRLGCGAGRKAGCGGLPCGESIGGNGKWDHPGHAGSLDRPFGRRLRRHRCERSCEGGPRRQLGERLIE